MTNDNDVNGDVIEVRSDEELPSSAGASTESILLAGSMLKSTLEPMEDSRSVLWVAAILAGSAKTWGWCCPTKQFLKRPLDAG
jgi:hypothetical protein